jgi:hypothetical protein
MREKAGVLEDTLFNRLRALAESVGKGGHRDEVQAAIRACLEYGFASIELGLNRCPPLPPEAGTHARVVAGRGTSTSILQDRYIAGHTLFKKFLWDERGSVRSRSDGGFGEALTASNVAFEKLVSFVRIEHEEELAEMNASPDARLLKHIKQLLAGKLIHPPSDIPYNFHGTHIGVVGTGPDVRDEIGRLAEALGAGQKLVVPVTPNEVWAWIGFQREPSASKLDQVLRADWGPAVRTGIGEPATGPDGWRQTHRQAAAAFPVATLLDRTTLRYRAGAMHASILSNDVFRSFLEQAFLIPLASGRDEGRMLRRALRAYFAANRNRTSAAFALGVSRQMLSKYLSQAEERIGQPLHQCAPELEAALLLDLTSEDVE